MTISSSRIERWLGSDRIERLSESMRGWYGPPILLADVPGRVLVHGDGDFSGAFDRGYTACALDALWDASRRAARAASRPGQLNMGFASISDALAEFSGGKGQYIGAGVISKVGPTGVANVTSSLWRLGTTPAAGGAGSAAPGGRACTRATTGAMPYTNPTGGDTFHLTGADFSASVLGNSLLLYDRLFDVAKTMASTATEAVTGVPTRYQNQTAGAADYIGGNFLFVEVGGTALAATAHNWTVCTYTDQGGAASTLPSLTGNSGAIVDRLDHPANSWFAPLESGDVGIKALTQMQCSAAVATGAVNFVMGHPIAVMAFPVAGMMMPFDWLAGKFPAPRIFDNACLALLELNKPSTTATTYNGFLYGGAG